MTTYISLSPIGLFAHDSEGKEVASVMFRDKDSIKDAFIHASGPGLTEDELKLLDKIKDKDIVFEIPKKGYRSQCPNLSGDILRKNLSKFAVSNGFCKNSSEFYDFIYDLNISMTKDSIKEASTEDRRIVSAITTIDELESAANTLAIKLKEWYGLYFPELLETVKSNEKLAAIISRNADRDTISEENAKNSIGGDFSPDDITPMQNYAQLIHQIYLSKTELENYVMEKSRQVMPNTSELINPMLAARLLAEAKNLKKLSSFPSSTIQIMGAQKALFRHMKNMGGSPKHGLIFQSPLVNQAPRKLRGKIARMLASKLSISLKMDYFDKKLKGGKKLKEDLDRRLDGMDRDDRENKNNRGKRDKQQRQ
ncbi:MAG: hypothetical protein U9P44_00710 [archaeon]|nr:hypothetical protein [archaeon]